MSTAEKLAAVLSGDPKIADQFGPLLKTIGEVARCGICAPPGNHMIGGDLIAIEACVAAWVADETDCLAQWRRFLETRDPELEPYRIDGLAAGFPAEIARGHGKVLTLAFQFMGGVAAFRNLAPPDFVITDDEIQVLKTGWRNRHPNIVGFWHGINRAAVAAVSRGPSEPVRYGKLHLRCEDRHGVKFLYITLPNGHDLAYPFVKLVENRFGFPAVSFMDNSLGKWVEYRHKAPTAARSSRTSCKG